MVSLRRRMQYESHAHHQYTTPEASTELIRFCVPIFDHGIACSIDLAWPRLLRKDCVALHPSPNGPNGPEQDDVASKLNPSSRKAPVANELLPRRADWQKSFAVAYMPIKAELVIFSHSQMQALSRAAVTTVLACGPHKSLCLRRDEGGGGKLSVSVSSSTCVNCVALLAASMPR